MIASPPVPGPPGTLIGGNLAEFNRDKLGFFLRCAREYGDAVMVRLGPVRTLFLNHPDAIEDVLVTHNHSFRKHRGLRMNTLLLGKGLLTSEGDFWLRQRRLIQPSFSKQRIVSAYAADMVVLARETGDGWRDGQAVDMHTEMTRLTLEITARTLFGGNVAKEAGEVGEALVHAMRGFDRRVHSWVQLPRWLPTPTNLRVLRTVRRLDAILFRFIRERRASGEDRDDLLSRLLNARDEDNGQGMSDKQLRDECMTLFLAGHETTALALSYTWYLLSQYPEALAKLHAELASVLGGRPPKGEDLPRLRYTEHVVTESMRVLPPVYAVGREATEDVTVGGVRVSKGQTVFLPEWVVHRDPRWYERPDEFDPGRWEGGLAQRIPKYAYFPFGGGPRVCIGNHFATTEAVLVLATLAQRWRFEYDDSRPLELWPSMTLRPQNGVPGVLRRRD